MHDFEEMYVCYADTVVPYIDIAFSVGFTNYFSNAFLLKYELLFIARRKLPLQALYDDRPKTQSAGDQPS